MRDTTFIYVLKDPTTGEIRYVGKTDNLRKRFRTHFIRRSKCHREDWIQSLVKQGLRPIMEAIDEVPKAEWQAWEVAYIQFYKDEGCDLVNTTAGGDAPEITDTTREKLRIANKGKKLSLDHIAKIRASNTGRTLSPEQCEKISIAKTGKKLPPFSSTHIERIRIGNLGKKRSEGTKQKIAESKIGRKLGPKSPEFKRKTSRRVTIYHNRRIWDSMNFLFV